MQGYNVIIVFNSNQDKVLMCKRLKNPYKGLLNLVGGKIEENEDGLQSAYRELKEETNISRDDIKLYHLMDFTYHYSNYYLKVYVGRLYNQVKVLGDENELIWSNLNNNFFDSSVYAGEGNIGHMLEQVKLYKDMLFK